MKRVVISLFTAVALLTILNHETVQAQEVSPAFKVGGGLGFPVDAEGLNMGPAILVGASLPVYKNVHAILEGHYSKYGADDELTIPGVDADAKLTGGNIGIMLRSSTSPIGVYGHGGLGLTRATGQASATFLGETISASSTENAFSFVVGGGVHIPVNPSIAVQIDARYNHAFTEEAATKWMPITVSVVFTP